MNEDYYNAKLIKKTYPGICFIDDLRDYSVTYAQNLEFLKKLEGTDKNLFVLVPDDGSTRKYVEADRLPNNITLSYCSSVEHAFITISKIFVEKDR
ncbi:unnamed protein product [marine sediment metagenome]|uniref:Uncharacterized protein n=1 Tax=marine sediment metagenome TaxID=412755 RepID=X1A774_9ZZZZ